MSLRKNKPKKCPNKKCRGYKRGMENIARLSRNFDNWYCGFCKSHYAGYNGKLKYYTKEKWKEQFNPEYDKGGKDFFPK